MPIVIYVKRSNDTKFKLVVNEKMKVSKLKKIIATRTNILAKDQRLFFMGQELHDQMSLKILNLHQKVIHVFDTSVPAQAPLPPESARPSSNTAAEAPAAPEVREHGYMISLAEIARLMEFENLRRYEALQTLMEESIVRDPSLNTYSIPLNYPVANIEFERFVESLLGLMPPIQQPPSTEQSQNSRPYSVWNLIKNIWNFFDGLNPY